MLLYEAVDELPSLAGELMPPYVVMAFGSRLYRGLKYESDAMGIEEAGLLLRVGQVVLGGVHMQ